MSKLYFLNNILKNFIINFIITFYLPKTIIINHKIVDIIKLILLLNLFKLI